MNYQFYDILKCNLHYTLMIVIQLQHQLLRFSVPEKTNKLKTVNSKFRGINTFRRFG